MEALYVYEIKWKLSQRIGCKIFREARTSSGCWKRKGRVLVHVSYDDALTVVYYMVVNHGKRFFLKIVTWSST